MLVVCSLIFLLVPLTFFAFAQCKCTLRCTCIAVYVPSSISLTSGLSNGWRSHPVPSDTSSGAMKSPAKITLQKLRQNLYLKNYVKIYVRKHLFEITLKTFVWNYVERDLRLGNRTFKHDTTVEEIIMNENAHSKVFFKNYTCILKNKTNHNADVPLPRSAWKLSQMSTPCLGSALMKSALVQLHRVGPSTWKACKTRTKCTVRYLWMFTGLRGYSTHAPKRFRGSLGTVRQK